MQSVRVLDVALDPRAVRGDALYSYLDDEGYAVGEALLVPLGRRTELGYIVGKREADAESLGFPLDKLKPPVARVEGLALPPALLDLAEPIAQATLCPLPAALSPSVPPGARDRLAAVWVRTDRPAPADLAGMVREALAVLDEKGEIVEARTKPIAPGVLRALKTLRGLGLAAERRRLIPWTERRKSDELWQLSSDSDRVERFLDTEGARKPAQALTLICLQEAEHGRLAIGEIKAMAGVTESTVRALIQEGLLQPAADEGPAAGPHAAPNLNRLQQVAFAAIHEPIQAHRAQGFLLFGVTGSGKTEVYLRAAAEALRAGRQVLYLVPEIALAAQAIAQLRARFGKTVTVLHSELTPLERLRNWTAIRSGEASVIVGARSAVFAPLANLGLIVMDEEHEGAYKQEQTPRYHTKRVVQRLAELHDCPYVLGSATPSIESYYEAEQERLTLLSLPVRATPASLPTVHIEDLAQGYRMQKPAIFTHRLQERLAETLARGEQAILFLNRRAYSPSLNCRDCGHLFMCPQCSVALSYHRRSNWLRCHQCDYRTRPPDACPKCGGDRLGPFGVGTERVEEAVHAIFPEAEVARLDRDIAQQKGAVEEVLAAFRSHQTNVLVGTQMVAKGLDFPNVTLVGVIAADVSLNLPDFRASERTFQLLSQVAGRAGRGTAEGEVIVQTFNPTHIAVTTAQTHDFPAFYESIRDEREQAGYPPFRRLVNVLFSGEEADAVWGVARAAKALLEPVCEALGPVDCAIERLAGRWRVHILAKLPPNAHPGPIRQALAPLEPGAVSVVIDVDPYSLM